MGDAPLTGVRVVEFGQLLAGPYTGSLLGDFGAEVIKVEAPGRGDAMRDWGRLRHNDHSLWWSIIARNKRSVTLDLRQPDGQEIARALAGGADVVVENFRPGTMERCRPVRSPRGEPAAHLCADHGLRPDGALPGPAWVRVGG
jgi:crotonobetainyl-CoA:carnitine CoA-transferase CaiB-like acyl-CoA transferase